MLIKSLRIASYRFRFLYRLYTAPACERNGRINGKAIKPIRNFISLHNQFSLKFSVALRFDEISKCISIGRMITFQRLLLISACEKKTPLI